MTTKSVVVIGGGTGTFTVLRGLKKYAPELKITAIISMTDSGGSTGRLRDEFGQLPVGDVRMALAALSRSNDDHEELLRELFLYRFKKGEGLSGHNLGNLFLTALTDILGSEADAVKAASRLLRIAGTVLPVTADNAHLVAEYDDGLVVEGEHAIDDPPANRRGHRIVVLTTKPAAKASAEALAAIADADLVVLGPGDLYSSILANIVIDDVPEALAATKAKLLYVSNLMERFGQTTGMSVADCSEELCSYIGRCPEYILINNTPLPEAVVLKYKNEEGVVPVFDDADSIGGTVMRTDLLSTDLPERQAADAVKRSLLRHDPDKLATAILGLIE